MTAPRDFTAEQLQPGDLVAHGGLLWRVNAPVTVGRGAVVVELAADGRRSFARVEVRAGHVFQGFRQSYGDCDACGEPMQKIAAELLWPGAQRQLRFCSALCCADWTHQRAADIEHSDAAAAADDAAWDAAHADRLEAQIAGGR